MNLLTPSFTNGLTPWRCPLVHARPSAILRRRRAGPCETTQADGRRLRDDLLGHHVARSINAQDVMRSLARAISEYGAPEYIRSDNGSEFIAKVVREGLEARNIKTLYIDPGSPWQNGFIESFNASFRKELLDREQFYTLTEARVVIAD